MPTMKFSDVTLQHVFLQYTFYALFILQVICFYTHTQNYQLNVSACIFRLLKFLHTAPSPDLVHMTDYIMI